MSWPFSKVGSFLLMFLLHNYDTHPTATPGVAVLGQSGWNGCKNLDMQRERELNGNIFNKIILGGKMSDEDLSKIGDDATDKDAAMMQVPGQPAGEEEADLVDAQKSPESRRQKIEIRMDQEDLKQFLRILKSAEEECTRRAHAKFGSPNIESVQNEEGMRDLAFIRRLRLRSQNS